MTARHAEVRLEDGRYGVVDVDPDGRGVRVNGQRIEPGAFVPLHPGDVVQLGECALLFSME